MKLKKQTQTLKLTKQRRHNEITAEQYDTQSKAITMEIDSLFSKREQIMERMGKTALSQAQSDLVETVLQDEKIADKFDKTIFTKLIDKVKVKNRYEIIFVFKNGVEIKAKNE